MKYLIRTILLTVLFTSSCVNAGKGTTKLVDQVATLGVFRGGVVPLDQGLADQLKSIVDAGNPIPEDVITQFDLVLGYTTRIGDGTVSVTGTRTNGVDDKTQLPLPAGSADNTDFEKNNGDVENECAQHVGIFVSKQGAFIRTLKAKAGSKQVSVAVFPVAYPYANVIYNVAVFKIV